MADGLRAKVGGATALHEVFAGEALDAFVLFSSNAGVWGSGGLGVYGAANAFLDAFAQWRRSQGLVATSVAWGVWDGAGMAGGEAAEQLRRRGLRPMAPHLALTALQRALDRDETFLAVADVDWGRFVPGFTAARPRPLIGELPEVRQVMARTAMAGHAESDISGLRGRLAGLSQAEQEGVLLELVREQVAAVLRHEGVDAVEAGRAFRDLGFDSLAAVELRNRLAAATGLSLPMTLVFDHPTSSALAEQLLAELQPNRTTPEELAHAELDRLDSLLSNLTLDEAERSTITTRLRNVLSKWGNGTTARDRATTREEIQSATAAEIFGILDQELSRP